MTNEVVVNRAVAALPVTPEDTADQPIAAAQAGAEIPHLHTRVPEDDPATGTSEIHPRRLPVTRQATGAVWSVPVAGRHSMPAEQVAKTVRILAETGSAFATPAKARGIIGHKGGDRVES